MDEDKIGCVKCYELHSAFGNETPCGPCLKPLLMDENEETWEIFEALLLQCSSGGMGGAPIFRLDVLPFFFEMYSIPRAAWPWAYKKIQILAQHALQLMTPKSE